MVRGNMLRRKLLRDMWRSKLQFASMLLLCALGTWVFTGLDAAWRMLDRTIETYYEEQNLADFWVQLPGADREALRRLERLPGVERVQMRVNVEMDTDLSSEATLQVLGYDGEAQINAPLLREGEALAAHDGRGLLLEEQFARANGLEVGDTLRLRLDGFEQAFTVRALALSPEYLITTKDVSPDPLHYGFAMANMDALSPLPASELLVDLAPDADADAVRARIEELYPYALIVDQQANASTQRARNDVEIFRKLSYVFPLLAFGVSSLIVLTTITRLIDGQRTQMGTLGALGYGGGRVARHYLNYAFYPSLAGALLGLGVGLITLPDMLWDMEAAHFVFPYRLWAPVSTAAWCVCGLSVALSCAVCLLAYRKAAREVTAALLRPKPPRVGSRVLLERCTGLWRRLGFNTKMVVRNLFRNKLRAAMLLVGILCCNMLIITSLGLEDSVRFFVGAYYDGTIQYDLRADLTDEAGTAESYYRRLEAGRVEAVMEKTVSLRGPQEARTTTLTVVEPDQQLLYLGEGRTYTPVCAQGVAVTQKMCQTLGIGVGDEVEIWLPGDDAPVRTQVAQVVYVNVGQGAYMTRTQWEALGKGAFTPTALLLQAPSAGCEAKLEQMDEVEAIKDPDEQHEQNLQVLQSLTAIFNLMSGAALGLAFVICYNMGILNFMEREREYATLKVLGYHQREIKRLMVRENNWITALGVLLGVGPGIWLTDVVMRSVESEQMVYGVHVELQSILIASVVTFAFSRFVQWLLTRNVRKIDMVTSLKSVE